MITRRSAVAVILAAAIVAAPAFAAEPQTEHTLKLSEGERPGSATIGDMAWLAGHWKGKGLGADVEEMWTAPDGGAMVGLFRLVRDGKPVFYELMTIVEENGSLVLRLKHFNPDMTGWEEKNRTVAFPFIMRKDGTIHFGGLAFQPEADALTMYLAIRDSEGRIREETFRYMRVKAE